MNDFYVRQLGQRGGTCYIGTIMKLKLLLNEDVISTDVSGSTKNEVIAELLDILVSAGKVTDRETALQDLLLREEKMSTGMQFGVAIPHAKTTAVKELVACIGISRSGVDFDSLDGKPSRIFIMTLSSVERTGPHVQFLAEISKVLKSAASREAMLAASSAADIMKLMGV